MTNPDMAKPYNRFTSAAMLEMAEGLAEGFRRGRADWFQRRSAEWLGRARDPTLPCGYRVIRATVYTDGERLVVTAHPDDVWPEHADSNGEHPHNCDQMGCGWEHVVLRGRLGD